MCIFYVEERTSRFDVMNLGRTNLLELKNLSNSSMEILISYTSLLSVTFIQWL